MDLHVSFHNDTVLLLKCLKKTYSAHIQQEGQHDCTSVGMCYVRVYIMFMSLYGVLFIENIVSSAHSNNKQGDISIT